MAQVDPGDLSLWSWLAGLIAAVFGGVSGAAFFVTSTRTQLAAHDDKFDLHDSRMLTIERILRDSAKADDIRRLEAKLDAHTADTLRAILQLAGKAS